MKKIVIVGIGNFARLMLYYLNSQNIEVVSFAVNREYMNGQSIYEGFPVVPLEDLDSIYPPTVHDVILGVGYSQMNNVRKELFQKCKAMGYTIATFVHPSAMIAENVKLGEGNIVLERTLIQPFATVGSGNLIWNDVKISHDDVVGDFNTITGNTSICGFGEIGNNCFLGNSCVIGNHVRIADYTLVGMGAVVKKNTAAYEVVVPARSVTLSERKSIDYI